MADLMILESLSFILSPSLFLQYCCPPSTTTLQPPQSADGLSPTFFYEFLSVPAAHNYSPFCLISQIKKIRLFVKEMYAAPLEPWWALGCRAGL